MNALPKETKPLADLRRQLTVNGYVPIPVAGKSPRIRGWQNLKPNAEHVEGLIRAHPDHTNTGLLTGDLVAIDIDALDSATSTALVEMVLDLPGGASAPCRVGKAPKCLFIFRATAPRKKATTGKFLINGTRCEVEVLGIGNQFVAYGIHPDTEAPYEWSNGSPADIAFADLPEITPDTLDTFLTAARELLAARGEPERKAKAANDRRPPAVAGDGPWAVIKTRALADLDAWVPALGLARLKRYQSGYLAVASFRPSRRAGLATAKRGQALEIAPASICDHSDGNKGYSPIDLVAVCLGMAPAAAADWLRDRVGGGARVDTTPPVAHVALLAKHNAKVPPVAANDNQPDAYPGIISSGELVTGFVPPDYHIDGIAQASFIYSVTAQTGAGKTAILLLTTALTALGEPLGNREVRKGRTLYFAGENPDDVTMRWIAMAHHMEFDPATIDAHFIKGTFSIPAMSKRIEDDVRKLGGVDLIVIDTSTAYFRGKDENANTELGAHARDLRALTTLPGRPCVLVAAHPTKSADQFNLLPRGGGAFLNEVDGNLVCIKTSDGSVKLHWHGKHRGPDFDPINFELRPVTAPTLKNSRGRDVPTVMAAVLSASDVVGRKERTREDNDDVLLEIERDPTQTLATIAERLEWLGDDGKWQKRRVQSAWERLATAKLVDMKRGKRRLTEKGGAEAVDIKGERHRKRAAAASSASILARRTDVA
ncbi:AAA family ATPase [Aurantimonas sp. C2-6-R+9]|uniref:AAA family ATPase n=1 Tax=unclassified Aurantimonas TaxID=2638230 RepID=UPI002E183638|nr:AAA family ATPase [Aurantimonas sp. C2-6-R+9]